MGFRRGRGREGEGGQRGEERGRIYQTSAPFATV